MARSVLAVHTATKAGTAITPTAADAAGSQWSYGGGRLGLLVINDSASAITVTIAVPVTVDGDLDVPDRVVSVAAGGMKIIKESASQRQVDGTVLVNYSDVTTVTVALIEF